MNTIKFIEKSQFLWFNISVEKIKFIKNKTFENLPKTSGVYFFYSQNNLIYIGKAINIKNRVKSHFFQPSYRDKLYISTVNKIGYLETNSEIEALVLEASLIKKHQPKFNVIWRDDKNYFYVAIEKNKNDLPFIYITHQPHFSSLRGVLSEVEGRRGNPDNRLLLTARNDAFVGPFVDGTALKKTLKFLRRAFPFYTAKTHPKIKCTWCHLELCPGPQPDLKLYKKNIKKLILVLQGKRSAVLNSLKKEMRELAKAREFEQAGKIRDQIFALQKIMEHTHVIDQDSGHPISALFTHDWENTEKELQKILWPSLRRSADEAGTKQSIHRIEAYDISNIQGKLATGSMVVFENGQPVKNLYKKFKINAPAEPNDILMLKEVLQRRFYHPEWKFPDVILIDGGKGQLNAAIEIVNNFASSLRAKRSNLSSVIPNLIGNPETRQAHAPLDSGFRQNDIVVIAIAKGRQELFIENREQAIPLKNLPQEVYNLIKHLDDEAHRFAITYHKKLRAKNLLK